MEFKGEIKGFPKEVIERMLFWQENQTGERDVSVFEEDVSTHSYRGGFNWGDTIEGQEFWEDVICNKNFGRFYEVTGGKTEETSKEPMRCYIDLGGSNKVEFLIDGLDINFDKGFIRIKAK